MWPFSKPAKPAKPEPEPPRLASRVLELEERVDELEGQVATNNKLVRQWTGRINRERAQAVQALDAPQQQLQLAPDQPQEDTKAALRQRLSQIRSRA